MGEPKTVDCFRLVRLARRCEKHGARMQDLIALAFDHMDQARAAKRRLALVRDPEMVEAVNGAAAGTIGADPPSVDPVDHQQAAETALVKAKESIRAIARAAEAMLEEVGEAN